LLGGQGGECAWGHDDINLERNQFGRESGEPLGLPLGISVFDHEVATLDVTEVTQSLEEGLAQVGGSGPVEPQVAYSSDLGRLLGLGRNRAEEPTEEKGDAEGGPQPYHLDSGPSNLFPRCFRIGPTSLWSRPRSLRRRSAAGRRPGRCIGLLGSLLCQSLQKGVSVLMCPEPVDQLSVTHVRDLRAEAVPNLAHALDRIEGL
jgi:hypothetical protein